MKPSTLGLAALLCVGAASGHAQATSGRAQTAAPPERAPIATVESVLAPLVESYGVSGMEAPVRAMVRRLLPRWARTETDTAGNLWLRLGRGAPVVVFVAHLDEIGFQVTSIGADGRLDVQPVGGLFPSLFEGQPALVHTGTATISGVFAPRDSTVRDLGAEAPASRDSAADAPAAPGRTPPPLRVDIGVTSRAAAESLGVQPGHTVTMPKEYTRLAGTRATGRSFDDRVGSAAQILAVRRLSPARLKHTVIFLWSTREEIGLEGATAAANALGGRTARVHAVDTFVSSDSPLERRNFAYAPLGRGPVARAADNSSVTPPAYVDSLRAVAGARRIPLQVGTTNGGNDGSVFVPYGVPDVPLSWPLRYAHSPAEVVDLEDVVGLADLIVAIAELW